MDFEVHILEPIVNISERYTMMNRYSNERLNNIICILPDGDKLNGYLPYGSVILKAS